MCFIIVRDNFSTQACARLFSILSGINSMVASSAPVIGGLLLDLTRDWHSGFIFNFSWTFNDWCDLPIYSKLQLFKA